MNCSTIRASAKPDTERIVMKSKKAGKRLEKVDALLSNVIEKYVGLKPDTLELLASAKESVGRVRAALSQVGSKTRETPLSGDTQASTDSERKEAATQTRSAARKTA